MTAPSLNAATTTQIAFGLMFVWCSAVTVRPLPSNVDNSSHEADTDNGPERRWFQVAQEAVAGGAVSGTTALERHPHGRVRGWRIRHTQARKAKPASTSRSFGIAKHASHRVKQIERQTNMVCKSGRRAGVSSEQTAHLKLDQGKRHEFPGVIACLHRKPERVRDAPNALRREKPQMLRRSHQPPMRSGETSIKRGKISRCNDNYASRIQMLAAQHQRSLRIGEMLDDIQQNNDIEHAKLR